MSPRLTDIVEAVETMTAANEVAQKKYHERLDALRAENGELLERVEGLEARANCVRTSAPEWLGAE